MSAVAEDRGNIDGAYELAKTIPGWLMPVEADYLYRVGYQSGVKNIVEIGTYFGKSTYLIAQGISDGGAAALLITIDVHFRGVDPESQRPVILAEDAPLALLSTIKGYDLDRIVVPMLGWSDLCVSMIDFANVGAVFIDGSHEFEEVVRDFRGVRGRMSPGTDLLFMFHDYHPDFPGVVRAVDECVKTDPGFRYVDLVHSLFVCSITQSGVRAGETERRETPIVADVQRRLDVISGENRVLRKQLAEATKQCQVWQRQAEEISNATLWRATAPVRWALDRLRGRR